MGISLREKLRKETVLLDGAFGTYIQSLGFTENDFKGRTGCMEYLTITRPDLTGRVHSDYLEAGSDAVETNTFGANAVKLSEYGLAKEVYEINNAATALARTVADRFSSDDFPRYVVGTMGPTGKLPSSTDPSLGNATYDELKKVFFDQALGIIDGGADALLVETGQDLLEMKAAVNGATEAMKDREKDLLLMAQCTLANNGRMLLGTEVSAVMATLSYLGVDVIGLNCSTGPAEMEGAVSYLSDNSPVHISCVPNAGLPVEIDGRAAYPLSPGEMAKIMGRFLKDYKLDVIGGCCGTTPGHIKEMRRMLHKAKKRKIPRNFYFASFYKGYDLQTMDQLTEVGERINTQGSRRMKDLLIKRDFDEIVELGKEQQRKGAEIIDVCAVLSERSTEKEDMVELVRRLSESVQVPLMIDSTDPAVVEAALKNYPGTAFINSVNLEDGGLKAKKIFALAREHGSFVVNLVIDEKGMARTVEHKLEVARRLYDIATKEYGLERHRLLFDMLTFTLAATEKEYADSAINTFKSIIELKKHFQGVLTILGASNVSFGLTREGRKVLNKAFIYHAAQAGLDAAIVDPSGGMGYEELPANEKRLAEDLLFNRQEDALNKFIEYFAEKKPEKTAEKKEKTALPVEKRIEQCITERDKTGIIGLVDEALKKYSAEDIINNILMEAMRKVGEKLDSGEMVLPYVLQSAEVTRKAIEYISGFLPHGKARKGGKVLLATVFGDVHDIGKNLVKMILQNNGFEVIDLGKQVPVETIIKEAGKNKVDAVGLSALLVSTARYMKTCIQEMHDGGLEYPIIIGGSPVNEKFAEEISTLQDKSIYKGGVFYAKDAFMGLKIVRALMKPETRDDIMFKYLERAAGPGPAQARKETEEKVSAPGRPVRKTGVPKPPFYGVRGLSNIPSDEVFGYLDENMLFNLAWSAGRAGKDKESLIEKEYKPLLKELKEEALSRGWLDFKAVYGYFKCRVSGESLEILDDDEKPVESIHFERAEKRGGNSLVDYFSEGPDGYDLAAFQAVTVGAKIGEAITSLIEKKEYSRGLFLHGLSVYLAEALAAYTHDRIRQELKLKKGQGKRYSPGYPLWSNMEDQKKIFNILECKKRLGLELTEGFQIVPEQSTTAMIVYNEKAEY